AVIEGSFIEEVGESGSSRPEKEVECSICIDDVPENEMFDIEGCTHKFCRNCVRKHIMERLERGAVKIPCLECEVGFLLPEKCRRILPTDIYTKWGLKLCENMVADTEKFYCPFKNCSALLINDGEGITQTECPYCHRMFCAQCKVAWHVGFNCREYQRLGEDERQSEDLLLMKMAKDNEWARCPKCHIFVEKIDGCKYISCRCGFGFCYRCGTEMDKVTHYCEKCKS
ncbi:E3 ubiquitin-protein ligase RNF144 protein, partial [Dioscorea alata]